MTASPSCQPLLDWLQRLPTNLAGSAIAADTALIEGGLLDSIAILELVSFLEESFALALPLEEFVPENFRTPATIAAMLERVRGAAAAPAADPVPTDPGFVEVRFRRDDARFAKAAPRAAGSTH
ncbi:MAG: acyl carrier protein [Alphaproteobacteria bacterium]|nr:acyl carrier protein [Alphaproteobacteria bacterium]